MKGFVIVGSMNDYDREEIERLGGHYSMTEGEAFFEIRKALPAVDVYTLQEFMDGVNNEEIDPTNSWVATITHD